jgi:hypothetical protein
VTAANLCARAGLVLLALTMSSVVFLVFDLVLGLPAAVASTAIALAFFATLWALVPMSAPKVED